MYVCMYESWDALYISIVMFINVSIYFVHRRMIGKK